MGVRLNHGIGDELQETHEINVTPFIDVMLVLLIIFMVAAPLATVDIPVDLPAAAARQSPRPDKPIIVTIEQNRAISIGSSSVSMSRLSDEVDRVAGGKKDTRVYLRADKSVAYGDLMEVMNKFREAGYLKVALIGLEAPVK